MKLKRKNPTYSDRYVYIDFEFDENPENTKFYIDDKTGGWLWSNDGYSTLTFLTRIFSIRWEDLFKKVYNLLKKEPFDIIRKNLIASIEDDDFYAITGDNVIWHFGDYVSDFVDDELKEIMSDLNLPEEIYDKFWDYFYYDFDDFMNWFKETGYYETLKKDLLKAKSLDELKDVIDDFKQYTKWEVLSEYFRDKIYETLDEIEKNE